MGALRKARRPASLIILPPPGTDPLPVVNALLEVDLVRPASVVVGLDPTTFEADLLGADLLSDRGWTAGAQADRPIGTALAHQVELADCIVATTALDARTDLLLDHLIGTVPRRTTVHRIPTRGLLFGQTGAPQRRRALHSAADDVRAARDGVWSTDLATWRPFHPGRLLERLATLAHGHLRGRGHFWLPTRTASAVPGTARANSSRSARRDGPTPSRPRHGW